MTYDKTNATGRTQKIRRGRCLSGMVTSVGIVSLLMGFSSSALAVAAADVGRFRDDINRAQPVLPHEQPPPPVVVPEDPFSREEQIESGQRIVLTGVTVEAGRLSRPQDDEAVQQLLQPWLERPLSFADLLEMTDSVTIYYRQRGFLVARAVIPPQESQDGRITLRIVEGLLDEPAVNNSSRLNTAFAEKIIVGNVCVADCGDTVATRSRIERAASLLNEVPGIQADMTLRPGSRPETTQLYSILTPSRSVGGYLGGDNYGGKYSGRNRGVGGAYINNLVGFGDQLNVNLMVSDTADALTGSVDYSSLVNAYGTRVGVRYSRLDYSLNGPFKILDVKGNLDEWGLFVTHPLARSFNARSNVRLDLFEQRYKDEILGMRTKRAVRGATVGFDGQYAFVPRGLTRAGGTVTVGDLSFENSAVSLSGQGEGSFVKVNVPLSHEQGFGERFSVLGQVTGQWASKTLDGSQKMLLGGPSAVRAYDVGTGSVDVGGVFTTELSSYWQPRLPTWLGSKALGSEASLKAALFYDVGVGQYYKDPVPGMIGSNTARLSGGGAYVQISQNDSYSLRLTWAHRTGSPLGADSSSDRFLLSLYKVF